jgi:hypothetical protein
LVSVAVNVAIVVADPVAAITSVAVAGVITPCAERVQ